MAAACCKTAPPPDLEASSSSPCILLAGITPPDDVPPWLPPVVQSSNSWLGTESPCTRPAVSCWASSVNVSIPFLMRSFFSALRERIRQGPALHCKLFKLFLGRKILEHFLCSSFDLLLVFLGIVGNCIDRHPPPEHHLCTCVEHIYYQCSF